MFNLLKICLNIYSYFNPYLKKNLFVPLPLKCLAPSCTHSIGRLTEEAQSFKIHQTQKSLIRNTLDFIKIKHEISLKFSGQTQREIRRKSLLLLENRLTWFHGDDPLTIGSSGFTGQMGSAHGSLGFSGSVTDILVMGHLSS
jgi:hypothetical protein